MVNFASWEEFEDKAKALYTETPSKTRILIKYKHKSHQVSVKVTNNVTVLKYKIEYQNDMRKLERLTSWLTQEMIGGLSEVDLSSGAAGESKSSKHKPDDSSSRKKKKKKTKH